jgi:hypothetical protein
MPQGKRAFIGFIVISASVLLAAAVVDQRPLQPGHRVMAAVEAWNTFFGSPGQRDEAWDTAVDANGNVYVAGRSEAAWGTPRSPYQGNYDGVVVKFDRNGNRLWHTFLGSGAYDLAYGLTLDDAGNIFVVGATNGGWGTPRNPYSSGTDGFVAKLDGEGNLQWNTFLGSNAMDEARAIARDVDGSLYVCGFSVQSWGAPINGHAGDRDVFAAKLDADGYVVWNTFLGGPNEDVSWAVVLDGDDHLLIAGNSLGSWGSPVDSYTGSWDAFAAELDTAGNLLWNTFMGTDEGLDYVLDAASDGAGSFYLAGDSTVKSWGAPLSPFLGSELENIFVVKLDASGHRTWNTFLGGADLADYGEGIALDGAGNIYVTGSSYASWGTPLHPHSGGAETDIYMAKLGNAGNLLWNTFYGSANRDESYDIFVDAFGSIYLAGRGIQNWGSPVNANVGDDAFVAKFTQTFNVDFSAEGGGQVVGNPNQIVYYGGNCTPVTAVPDPYHVLVNWTGNGGFVTTGQNPLTVAGVTADMSIIGHMREILPPTAGLCERVQNRGLLQVEYINVLRWVSNSGNDGLSVEAYRVYDATGGTPWLLAEVDQQTFEYRHRNAGSAARTYHIVCVANGVEGEPLVVTL